MYRPLPTRFVGFILCLIVLAWSRSAGQTSHPSNPAGMQTADVARAIGNAGIRFTENRGQIVDTRGKLRPDILYTTSAAGVHLFLRRDAISYVFTKWVSDTGHARSDIDPLAVERAKVGAGALTPPAG